MHSEKFPSPPDATKQRFQIAQCYLLVVINVRMQSQSNVTVIVKSSSSYVKRRSCCRNVIKKKSMNLGSKNDNSILLFFSELFRKKGGSLFLALLFVKIFKKTPSPHSLLGVLNI